MLQWLNQYSGALNALFNLGMVTIWLVYFNLVVAAYKRQRQTKLIIDCVQHGEAQDCVVINMSPEPVFLDAIVASVNHGDDKTYLQPARHSDHTDKSHENSFRFGALQQGKMTNIGSFDEILRESGISLDDGCQNLELTVVAVYGPEDLPVGCSRCFAIKRDEDTSKLSVSAESSISNQIRSRKDRRKLENLLRERNGF
ncbi:hypothetical protein [Altericroceibacterium endophyticum]|uniref:Uncharacterized protein n=1 Tax=Altericroceibacterium endophyticum TaxID=1808508 RepID=A0A6I4T255_9SPHN|nr:hypothetical protein [Altericroceibacterium endophyticum]MXO64422.1 hypothetical protein [Altericroceibacterium endophyticum]